MDKQTNNIKLRAQLSHYMKKSVLLYIFLNQYFFYVWITLSGAALEETE